MAPAVTSRASSVRKRHAEHPTRPAPASKPGTPSSGEPGGHDGGGGQSGVQRSRGGGEGPVRNRRSSGNGRSSGKGGGMLASLLPNAGPHLPDALSEAGKPSLPMPHFPIWARLAARVLKRVAKHELRRLAKRATQTVEGGDSLLPDLKASPVGTLIKASPLGLLLRVLEGGPVFELLRPQLPIQEAIDIGVPLEFAWQQWSQLRFLPEGVDRVTDIERGDDGLSGRVDGDDHRPWSAEVLDERECESFAWRSTDGSDCAGLVTFHRLSERLTRLELTLDVVPRDAGESAELLTRFAHRRARGELRRFKADLELVSPDVYAGDESSSPH